MNDYELKAYVTNLGKYNEGELVGEWVSFPVSADEMKAVLDRIQIGHPDDFGVPYEEIFITDYDTDIYGLQNLLGEFTSLEELNYLAGRLDEMSTYEIDKFKAVLESGIDIEESGLSGIINLTYSLDKYEIMSDISDEYDLGYYWVHDSGVYDIKSMGPLADYIDYQAFGESIVDEEFGMFCEAGYVRDNGDSWNYEYAGDRDDIPSEYRLFNSEEEPEMTVLLVEPGKEPKVITMGTDLESLQHAVNGYIQAVYPFEDRVAVICNDEGKINGMELNRALYTPEGEMYDILAGPFIVAGLTEDNFGSLTQEQIEKFSELFRTPEMFLMENGRIKAVPVKESDTFEIFQIDKNLPESRDISFVSYEGLRKMGKTPNKADYSQVYTGNYAGESLDAIYERFNLYHPADFRGHSLSVSDVIVLHQDGVDTAYYVDSFGFRQIPEFFASNPLEKVEELMEDDYGMIDGIINNGSRKDDDPSRKPSVLEKLEEKKQEAALLQQNAAKPEKSRSKEVDLG